MCFFCVNDKCSMVDWNWLFGIFEYLCNKWCFYFENKVLEYCIKSMLCYFGKNICKKKIKYNFIGLCL